METAIFRIFSALIFGFKSYYVVWKRRAERDKMQGKNSLNRTM